MFCTQCGTQAKATEKFCTQCGASLIMNSHNLGQEAFDSIEWMNPLQCRTTFSRRLSISILFVALITWIGWVAVASDGFSSVHPIGWLVFFGLPVVVYLALLFGVRIYSKAPNSKTIRYVISANIIWIFVVSAWGFIWNWDNVFREEEYIALFVLPILGSWLSIFLWRWSTKE